ncbi:D-alanine--D-alanine ligase [Pelagirhabdus alkalitolerans]|uniref:D-alanine--D-alanine ligase n=1 Tax=Pelagirhabdus alkalitolerans TaxID=1612202 RepID=A0A1G6JJZ9_9BACI|nr:D-alanine--D-alanine ligase [Pelagirhabdus alkalitolerans]SDC19044.1 D-alanine--D-alanine ligase [Pelagirhabdus alkalitolerans]
MEKLTIGIVFGGKSSEHEVSLQSTKNVVEAMDRTKYNIVLIGVDKSGRWHLCDESDFLNHADDPARIQLNKTNQRIAVVPGEESAQIIELQNHKPVGEIDCIFPVIHGTLGEDGSLQGLLRTLNLPFVGVDLLGSAVSMDKDIAKRLLRDAGLSVANGFVFKKHQHSLIKYETIVKELSTPLFVKPVNQGSSVGVNKVNSEAEFYQAIDEAFQYDDKLLIEETVNGREIECAILGNEDPKASLPGEILPQTDFYSYESKYINESGAKLQAPARLSEEETKRVQQVALNVFNVLDCEGMARVDFFMKENGDLIINEVNTIPGFTKISMYPKLWEITGLTYPELIDRLIVLAFERFNRKQQLKSAVFE